MPYDKSLAHALALVAGTLADHLPNRQAVIDDLHCALGTVIDQENATPETISIVREVIEYIQAGVDVDQQRFRRKAD